MKWINGNLSSEKTYVEIMKFSIMFCCPHFWQCRQIQGPFALPPNFSMDPLIVGKDYDHPNLSKADPKKDLFRNSNDEYFIETDSDVCHGRKAAM